MIPSSSLRRAIAFSVAMHAVVAIAAAWLVQPARAVGSEVVDIELAPPVPAPEALPPELPKQPVHDVDHQERQAEPAAAEPAPNEPGETIVDAGVDARPDAAIDAAVDARPDARPDAAIDAATDAPDATILAEPTVPGDAGVDDASVDDASLVASNDLDAAVEAADASVAPPRGLQLPSSALVAAVRAGSNAEVAATAGSGSGSNAGSNAGSGSAIDTAALAEALASAVPAPPGTAPEPAVDGAPTTAGTAANLMSYFPDGHIITAMVRLDRLRGTEWAAQTEHLLRPLPDYQLLFGARDAAILDKLETLVISTPRPRDANATTLVGRTQLSRAALRDALGAGSTVAWSVARGGLLGKRTGKRFPGDNRVFLSPYQGWFLLAQPGDLGALTQVARGKLDTAVAAGPLPPWLAGIRAIESESGDPRGPALVVTVAAGGQRYELPGYGIGLGVRSIPTPERASLAAELVPQGWLVRGNLRFASDADAAEFVTAVQGLQQRFAGPALQAVLGKRLARVAAALAFARNGARVSYATSVSIADARAILAAVARQVEQYFRRMPGAADAPSPPGQPSPAPR